MKIARRDDGWPLCPCCGEDEAFVLPPGDIAGCYVCGPAITLEASRAIMSAAKSLPDKFRVMTNY